MITKHAHQELEKKFIELERIFNFSMDMIGVGNLAGYFTKINSSFSAILGYNNEEFLAVPFLEFVHHKDFDNTKKALAAAANGEREILIENRYKCKDGSYKWIDWKVLAIAQEDRFFAVGRDITERKRAEDALKTQRNKLQRMLSEIKTLQGLLPICMICKKIRDDRGYWKQLEKYLSEHANVKFSHGICPDCYAKQDKVD